MIQATLNAALEALSRVDMVLAATAPTAYNPSKDAPVWTAIRVKHHSVRPALDLTQDEVRELEQTLQIAQKASFSGAACAPVAIECRQVERLHPGHVSMLCQVRSWAPSYCSLLQTVRNHDVNTHALLSACQAQLRFKLDPRS